MSCSEVIVKCCGLGCFFAVSLLLQGTGLFSPRWVTIDVDNQTVCYQGLVFGLHCDGVGGNLRQCIVLVDIVSLFRYLWREIELHLKVPWQRKM